MAEPQISPTDPWVRLAVEKIREKYLRTGSNPSPSRLHQQLMDKVHTALFWLDVSDGPDGYIGEQTLQRTMQRKLTGYAQRQEGTERTALQSQIGTLVGRIEAIPTTNGRIDRDRLETAISSALRDTLVGEPGMVSEIRHVSGEALGSLNAAALMDTVVRYYSAQPAR